VTPPELVAAWRARAEELKPYAPAAAHAFETASIELEQALLMAAAEPLKLRDAALESGYSVDHLARLIRQGKLRNAGRPNAPRVRRGDLPRKSARLPNLEGAAHLGPRNSRQIVRAIAEGDDQR